MYMMMTRKTLSALLVLLALLAAPCARAEISAAQLLERCADKLREAPSVGARFSVRASDGSDVGGDILMSRERFRMTSPALRVWFDGRTQWTALASTKEVSISEPTSEELLSGNPFAIITGYAGRFNCRMLKAQGAGATVRDVELTPRTPGGDIRKATISIDTRTLWPVRAVIVMSSGATVSASISDCRTGGKPAASAFTFNHSVLPGYELVDLR